MPVQLAGAASIEGRSRTVHFGQALFRLSELKCRPGSGLASGTRWILFHGGNTDASDMSGTWLQRYLFRQASGASGRRWCNWKESAFYGFAEAYRSQTYPGSCGDPADACLTVNSQPSQHVVVIASGKRLPKIPEVSDVTLPLPPLSAPYNHIRSPKNNAGFRKCLQGDNAVADGPLPPLPPPLLPYRSFVSAPAAATFSDVVGYLPRP